MRANKRMDRKGDGNKRKDTQRPRKCLQDASHEEVPMAVTTAVAPVAMGTSKTKKQCGQTGQIDSVLPFLTLGNTRNL